MTVCPKCGLSSHRGRGCPKRKHRPARELISFDCETNSHGVVLFLAADDGGNVDYLYNGDGLGLAAILDWMIRAGAGKLSFGFYFDYDVNQLIGMLPELHIVQLAAVGRVTWRDYSIRHTPGKKFQVSRGSKSITIWDCASWAQCSFVKVCDTWKLGTEAERELVRAMKAKRGDFDNSTESELVAYTTLECSLLTSWVRTLLKLHEDCGIALRAYSGPGSTASAMIRQQGWKPPDVPPLIQAIAEKAFFGGRTEITSLGPVPGPIHGYDINSAYPAAIATLPEIRDKKWFRVREYRPGMWGFYRVRWKQRRSDCWGLFPLRGAMLPTGKRSVSLLYPTDGEGWFHSSEVDAAIAVAPDAVEIVDGRVIEPTGKPFDWVLEMAARRLEYKAKGDARAYPLKVGLNSVYGKLAQHSGTHPLQCLTYAACVTGTTRGALLRAAYKQQHAVILLATDGILSTVPLDLPIGPDLGQWEHDEYDSAWMLQAGVYWAGDKKRTRGIDARALSLDDVDDAWNRYGTSAAITLDSRRVLSYRLCVAQHKTDRVGTWYSGQRTVRFSPAPRRRSYRWRGDRLLTIPARTADFKLQAELDAMVIAMSEGQQFDEFEAMPDWALPE